MSSTRNEAAVALLCDLPAHFVLPSSVPRYARVAVKMRCQDVEAMTPVGKLYGVGTVTTAVFKEAGMETVGSIKHNEHPHHDLQPSTR